MSSFADQKNALKWNLFAHTNSGIIAKNPDVETTSHVFGFYSRSYSYFLNLKSYVSVYTSVTTPHKIDRDKNQNTLGDRFFYGTDELIVSTDYPNFVTATIASETKTTKYFLPISNNLFTIGDAREGSIKQLFDSFAVEKNATKDYFWGKLIYDRNSSTPN